MASPLFMLDPAAGKDKPRQCLLHSGRVLGGVWARLIVALNCEVSAAQLERELMRVDAGGGKITLAKKAGWMLIRKVAMSGCATRMRPVLWPFRIHGVSRNTQKPS